MFDADFPARRGTVPALDGSAPMHPVLRSALQDPATPQEVKAVILDIQTLDAVDAALEARLFARALRSDDLPTDSPVARRRAWRQAFHDWRSDFPKGVYVKSGDELARIMDARADEELREVI